MADIPGIPSVPTDNLYKFIATVGVIILLISIAVPLFITIPNNEKKDRLWMDLGIQTQTLVEEMIFYDTLKSRLDRSHITMDGLVTYTMENDDSSTIVASLGLYEAYENQQKKLDSIFSKKSETVRGHNSVVMQDAVYRRLSYIGTFVGIFLMAFGFYFWHNKVQIYLDLRGRIEAGFDDKKGDLIIESNKKLKPLKYIILVCIVTLLLWLINTKYVHRHTSYKDPQGAKIADEWDDKYENPFK